MRMNVQNISCKSAKMNKNVSKHPENQQNRVQNFLKLGNFKKILMPEYMSRPMFMLTPCSVGRTSGYEPLDNSTGVKITLAFTGLWSISHYCGLFLVSANRNATSCFHSNPWMSITKRIMVIHILATNRWWFVSKQHHYSHLDIIFWKVTLFAFIAFMENLKLKRDHQ